MGAIACNPRRKDVQLYYNPPYPSDLVRIFSSGSCTPDGQIPIIGYTLPQWPWSDLSQSTALTHVNHKQNQHFNNTHQHKNIIKSFQRITVIKYNWSSLDNKMTTSVKCAQ